jgi:hypothetical protein
MRKAPLTRPNPRETDCSVGPLVNLTMKPNNLLMWPAHSHLALVKRRPAGSKLITYALPATSARFRRIGLSHQS